MPQEAVKPGTALDCSQFEETQVAAFDNDEYFTTRKSDIIYAVEVQEVSENKHLISSLNCKFYISMNLTF